MQTPCQTHGKPPKLECQRDGGRDSPHPSASCKAPFPSSLIEAGENAASVFGMALGCLGFSISTGPAVPLRALFLRRTGTTLLGEADPGGQLATERVKQGQNKGVPGRDDWLGCELGRRRKNSQRPGWGIWLRERRGLWPSRRPASQGPGVLQEAPAAVSGSLDSWENF